MQRNPEISDSLSDDAIDASQKIVETPTDSSKRAKPIEIPVVSMQKLNRFPTISKIILLNLFFSSDSNKKLK